MSPWPHRLPALWRGRSRRTRSSQACGDKPRLDLEKTEEISYRPADGRYYNGDSDKPAQAAAWLVFRDLELTRSEPIIFGGLLFLGGGRWRSPKHFCR